MSDPGRWTLHLNEPWSPNGAVRKTNIALNLSYNTATLLTNTFCIFFWQNHEHWQMLTMLKLKKPQGGECVVTVFMLYIVFISPFVDFPNDASCHTCTPTCTCNHSLLTNRGLNTTHTHTHNMIHTHLTAVNTHLAAIWRTCAVGQCESTSNSRSSHCSFSEAEQQLVRTSTSLSNTTLPTILKCNGDICDGTRVTAVAIGSASIRLLQRLMFRKCHAK